MILTVHKIHEPAINAYGKTYIRVTFLSDDGIWFKTDLVRGFKNFKNWKLVLKAGINTRLDDLVIRRMGEVDGDSKPKIISA